MKPASIKIILVLTGAIIFNAVFWAEKIALNALFFDVFILAAVIYLYPPAFQKAPVRWLLIAHIITLIAVLVHNTFLSKLAFTLTLMLLVVFVQFSHRSLWYAAGTVLSNYWHAVPGFTGNVRMLDKHSLNMYRIRKALRFAIIPLIILSVFCVLYSSSNVVFNDVMGMISSAVSDLIEKLFSWFSWSRLWFLLLGIFITGGLLLAGRSDYFLRKDLANKDQLIRKKNNLQQWKQTKAYALLTLLMGRFANGVMALRNEFAVGLISMLLLNILLLFINILDIKYVWFGFSYNNDINLSQYVHEGAGLLIFSILLAMGVLLFFFRGNLNFYQKNKWLRWGAYCWIFQNTVLVVSVFFRDYYYIHQYGLAYKRLGVLFFLLLVIAGLVTVFMKISNRQTNYFLFKVNAWVVLTVMVLASCVHWDETIAGYNIARKNTIPLDIKFLLSLSDKALPVIEKNKDILARPFSTDQFNNEGNDYYRSGFDALKYFEQRKTSFFAEQETYSWLSWNMADAAVKKELHAAVLPIAVTSNR